MLKPLFITGTDTGVGKTFVSSALLQGVAQRGFSTLGLKPVASGCELINGEWQNEDALQLMAAASVQLPYSSINPWALRSAIAPHLAAKEMDVALSVDAIVQHCQQMKTHAQFTLVEGAGGWLVPLNNNHSFAEIAQKLAIPALLVVGVRLGCINHALLTAAAIRASGVPLLGWVANCTSADSSANVSIEEIATRIGAPCIGQLPFIPARHAQNSRSQANTHLSRYLDVDSLIELLRET